MSGNVARAGAGGETSVLLSRAITGFVILGIVLRLVRYLQIFPMWCDETMLAANLLERRWTELAQPLAYRQVCPLGFLAWEWAVVQLLGFSELSLRLIPALSALASVPLFHFLARRVLGKATSGTLLAVALFAVSEPLIRFAGEVKPYATDLLVSLVLLSVAVTWLRAPERGRGLWVLAALAPLAIGISLPSIFLIGSLAVVGLWEFFRRRKIGLLIAYGGFVASAALAIAAMAALGQYNTTPADRAYFLKFWATAFPPSCNDPTALARWLIRSHTGPLFACLPGAGQGQTWVSALFFGCFVAGIVVLGRREVELVRLFVIPFLLAIVAAAMRRYPYGTSVRVAQFLVPATLLLGAAGVAWLCTHTRQSRIRGWVAPALAIVLVATGLWRVGCDLVQPARAPWDRTSREFARWFWEELSTDAELVCVRTDLGISVRPGQWSYDGSDQYLCFQRIYSRRHRQANPPRWDAVSRTRPLRCVLLNRMPADVPAFLDWIEAHRDRYTLREVRSYRATRGSAAEPAQTYVVCEFLPAPPAVAAVPGPTASR